MADWVYGLPKENPTPLPQALQIGLDWKTYHTPPYAGGLADQPMQLLRDVRSAVYTYNAISSWRDAQQLSAERLQAFYATHGDLVKFMEYVWSLQEHAPNG